MKKTSILTAMFAIIATASAVRAEMVVVDFDGKSKPQSMHEIFTDSPQFFQNITPAPEPSPMVDPMGTRALVPDSFAAPKREFRLEYDFLAINRGEGLFSPLSDLYKLKAVIRALPEYLTGTDLGFESHRRILEIIANGEHNLDAMLLKYSAGGLRTTRPGFLMEAGPAMNSLRSAFLALKGAHDGGSYSDNCWDDCVEDCKPNDIGGIVCHVSCYWTCETLKP